MYYSQYNLGPTSSVKKTFEACQKVVDGSHPDSRHLRHVYAIMAGPTLEWSAFGTFDDAVIYHQKMVACEKKQIQLYKKQGVDMERQHLFTSQAHYKYNDPCLLTGANDRKTRDVCTTKRGHIASRSSLPQKCNARCLNCDKGESNGLELSKCGGCKQVYYCSKEYQTNNWTKHQKACTLLAELAECGEV